MENLFFIFLMALPIIVLEFALKGLKFYLGKLFNKKYLNYPMAFGLFFVVFNNPIIFSFFNEAIHWFFGATILPNTPEQLLARINPIFFAILFRWNTYYNWIDLIQVSKENIH